MIQPENHLCSARIRIAFGDENGFQQLFSLWRILWTRFGNEEVYWVPMVHLLMVWLWSGGLMSAWYLWDGRCLVGEVEYWCSSWSCDVGLDDVASVGDIELWRWFGPVPLFPVPPLIPYFPKCPPNYFPYPFWSHISQSALLNTYALMVLCWGCCSLLSMGWVSLSSKEMPLTCAAVCWMWLGAQPTGLSLIWGLGGAQHLWAPVPADW